MDVMGDLFKEARSYGRVMIFTQDNGCYYVKIEFNSVRHTTLEAKSGFTSKTPEQALHEAIEAAKGIINSIAEIKKTALEYTNRC